MKLDGDDMHYNNPEWIVKRGEKVDDFAANEFLGHSILTNNYYNLNIKQLLIEAYSPQGTVTRTLLEKNHCRPLV